MQITEQLIERIARRVFNSMFAPALRQSNVQGGGTPSSVRYAEEAGHAASADSADAVPWTGVSGKPTTATRWPTWSEVSDKPSFATVATSGSYNDLSNKPSIPTPSNLHSGYAANADYAVNAGSATSAGHATNANYATSSGSCSGNAATATALQTTRTLWGQSFNGTGNVSGDLVNVGDIDFNASGHNFGEVLYFDTNNKRIGINNSSPIESIDTKRNILSQTTKYWNKDFNGIAAYVGRGESASNNLDIATYSGSAGGGYVRICTNSVWATSVLCCTTDQRVGIGIETPSYKLHVVGTIYATGSITERSDIRCKDVETYQWSPTLDMIADAPIIRYTMKDDKTHRMRVGSVAQYWEKMIPETVSKDNDGILSIAQGDICMVNVIALARVVRKMREEIEQMRDGRN